MRSFCTSPAFGIIAIKMTVVNVLLQGMACIWSIEKFRLKTTGIFQ